MLCVESMTRVSCTLIETGIGIRIGRWLFLFVAEDLKPHIKRNKMCEGDILDFTAETVVSVEI